MRILTKPIILLLVASFLAVSVFGATYPKLNDFVTDNANIIDSQNKAAIAELAKEIEQKTTVEVAVVTIPSLEGLDIETYAVELFEKAGIGKKDLNNGLLILIALDERKYRIEVGYGLEGTLPDVLAMQIGTNIFTPNFRNNEYGKGVYDALVVIKGYLENNEEVISKYKSTYARKSDVPLGTLFSIIITALFFLSALGNKIVRAHV